MKLFPALLLTAAIAAPASAIAAAPTQTLRGVWQGNTYLAVSTPAGVRAADAVATCAAHDMDVATVDDRAELGALWGWLYAQPGSAEAYRVKIDAFLAPPPADGTTGALTQAGYGTVRSLSNVGVDAAAGVICERRELVEPFPGRQVTFADARTICANAGRRLVAADTTDARTTLSAQGFEGAWVDAAAPTDTHRWQIGHGWVNVVEQPVEVDGKVVGTSKPGIGRAVCAYVPAPPATTTDTAAR